MRYEEFRLGGVALQIIMALLLDAIFGDPRGIPHPVAGIGRLISFYEKFFYGRGGSKAGGAMLCAAVLVTVGAAVSLVLSFAAFIGEWAYAAVNIYLLYAATAFKSLKDESAPVARLLAERGMNATFFLGGIWAERNGDTVVRLAADGFELGNHGYLHRDHATLSAERNRSEIVITEKLLSATLADLPAEAQAAALPKLFAPPSGSMGDAMHAVCEQLGYTVVMWTRDTIDWRDHDAALITERALRDLAAGDLILMHPTAATAEALPAILDGIAAAGLTADTVTATLAL